MKICPNCNPSKTFLSALVIWEVCVSCSMMNKEPQPDIPENQYPMPKQTTFTVVNSGTTTSITTTL